MFRVGRIISAAMDQWYYQRGASEHGPCTSAELRGLVARGVLPATTLVRPHGSTAWLQAGRIVAVPGFVESPQERDARFKRRVITAAVILALLLLLMFLLLWWLLGGGIAGSGGGSGGGVGTGVGQGTGSGEGPGSGEGSGGGSGGGSGSSTGDDVGPDGGGPVGGTPSSDEPHPPAPPQPAPTGTVRALPTELVLGPLTPVAQPKTAASSGPSELGGGPGGGGGGGGGSDVRDFLGVRVKGKIALVCDISGSMTSDFPILVRQLREKFPKDTPLILVEGCHFGPAGSAPPPQKSNGPIPYMNTGQPLENDPHTYYCSNTTDAIIFAVEELNRNTVMFNSDLQDGGSQKAIDDLERVRKKRKFVLSGRSLNCDAPERLLAFIKSSGGDFKVDTLTRTKMPAVPWGP